MPLTTVRFAPAAPGPPPTSAASSTRPGGGPAASSGGTGSRRSSAATTAWPTPPCSACRRRGLAPGGRFCEWGSGLGVVCCLAAMAGFAASGVEARGRLVRASRRLAADFDLPAEFARGSYIPGGARAGLLAGREFAWLTRGGRCGHEALGAGPDEFDLVYAYPWPDEEGLVGDLFEGHARPGALLLTYHGERGMWLRRKGGPRAP
ncbi:MAG: hypothetical protein U0797_17890 [Gemmataceae bacterium]